MSDEYELMPANELEELRKEVEVLKENPFGETKHGKSLLASVEQLTSSINRLIKVFSDAQQELLEEFEQTKTVQEQLEDLKDENKKIASGILTLADMIREQPGALPEPPVPSPVMQQPMAQTGQWDPSQPLPSDPFGSPQMMPPPPGGNEFGQFPEPPIPQGSPAPYIGPPPPKPPVKKSLFGR